MIEYELHSPSLTCTEGTLSSRHWTSMKSPHVRPAYDCLVSTVQQGSLLTLVLAHDLRRAALLDLGSPRFNPAIFPLC